MMRGYSATNETAGASARVAFKSASSGYKVGRKVFKTLQQVQGLTNEGDFKEVPQPVPENLVDERPLPPTVVGLQSTFDRVWRCLMEEQMGIVGLYGMGEKSSREISGNIQEHEQQKDLFNESWNSRSLQEKSQDIVKNMSNKKFVLLLDHIWELVDLSQVGLPVPCRTSASNKTVFTARELEVCGQMEAHKSFKVERLGYEDAWKLFEEKVGKEILDSHPDIPELAETVAKECGGLPLALITVGRAMASKKTPREWEHAIEVLRSSAYKFSEEEDNHVKMHDVIRDMALWIASTIDKDKEKFCEIDPLIIGLITPQDLTQTSKFKNQT
ncbi:putative disease resistance protein [Citrus sinensis]|nr:putative disease resistance protein [Citrus sinensis]